MKSHWIQRRLPLLALAALASACATPGDGGSWTCSATGMVSAKYDGSGYAYIHLSGFQSGGSYAVKLNDAKTEASGVTANGTPFSCKKAA